MVPTEPTPAAPGSFPEMDPPDHTRYRKLLTSHFTARKINLLAPRVEEIVTHYLDEMEKAGPPVDLLEAFAMPVPSLVICELLGVPYEERAQFQTRSAVMVNMTSTPEETAAAFGGLHQFVHEIVLAKRAAPTQDLLGQLAAGDELTDEELTTIGLNLLFAGHGLTANMLALGAFALIDAPEQLAALHADPALIDGAVEELLRFLTIVHVGPTRTALADIELGGQVVRAGETVTLSLPAANRDPAHYEDPDILDISRGSRQHLALGHGLHQCLGQELARMQMRIAYPALFGRFPDIRLAVPREQIPMRDQMAFYGVLALPVAWG
ncbi:cytochrome P450 [Micromonospora sp. ALFpr18c]|uniref:cytochrome P450 n=1 Tax=unclassified Micromonospora TaxID=2617518 RepID=UPI00124B744C|nr:cytochrome P450 [Micromonospora sp. ALFpr18c]KAB1927977.1 cytochrome P450 [Micromonospora sp. ALFpr18c]